MVKEKQAVEKQAVEKQTENVEEPKKTKEKQTVLLGFVCGKDGKFDEYEFTGKAAVREFIREECKAASTNKEGWVPLKEGGNIKFMSGRVLKTVKVTRVDLI